jgi:hypothetical protein
MLPCAATSAFKERAPSSVRTDDCGLDECLSSMMVACRRVDWPAFLEAYNPAHFKVKFAGRDDHVTVEFYDASTKELLLRICVLKKQQQVIQAWLDGKLPAAAPARPEPAASPAMLPPVAPARPEPAAHAFTTDACKYFGLSSCPSHPCPSSMLMGPGVWEELLGRHPERGFVVHTKGHGHLDGHTTVEIYDRTGARLLCICVSKEQLQVIRTWIMGMLPAVAPDARSDTSAHY